MVEIRLGQDRSTLEGGQGGHDSFRFIRTAQTDVPQ